MLRSVTFFALTSVLFVLLILMRFSTMLAVSAFGALASADTPAGATEPLRASLVKIMCTAQEGSAVPSISGSGVFITPSGYILTNAHIAAYFLLGRIGVSCLVRVNDEVQVQYHAQLAYIPGAWVGDHIDFLRRPHPSGTGERDFAVLAVTTPITGTRTPAPFPALSLSTVAPAIGMSVSIGSYGTAPDAANVSPPSPIITFALVHTLLTFETSTPDAINFGSSATIRSGSSGGGVVGPDGSFSASLQPVP